MIFAKECKEYKKMTRKHVALIGTASIIGAVMLGVSRIFFSDVLWSKGLWWYPFILLTPGICVIISYTMHFCEKSKILTKFKELVELVGKYSFEIYLVHIPLIEIIDMCINKYSLQKFHYLVWIIGVIVLAIGCAVLKYMANLSTHIIKNLCKKRFNSKS